MILYLVLLVVCLILLLTLKREKTIDLVISRYNEDLDWLDAIDLKRFRRVIVYNKGPTCTYSKSCVEIIPLNNVGRVDHTYLYHIIKNYDHLAYVTLFLPASCNLDNKKGQTQRTIDNTLRTCSSYFETHDETASIRDFYLDSWKATSVQNASINNESELLPCPERPFGAWYTTHFGRAFPDKVVYMAIFSATREQIHHRSRDFYRTLCRYVDHHSNPEAGHYLERSWYTMFN